MSDEEISTDFEGDSARLYRGVIPDTESEGIEDDLVEEIDK